MLTGLTASISKAVSIVISILTVRLTLRYLGAERFGMWMTISSIVMMFAFADFGMSNGLVNLVAIALGRDDLRAARQAAASAFWMLCTVAGLLTLVAAAAYPFVDAASFFNVHSAIAMHEAGPALLVFFVCFILNLPLGVVRGTQTGMQNAFINNLWSILGSVFSLVFLLIAIHFRVGLPLLVLGLSGAPILALLLNGIELFGWSHRDLMPSFNSFSRESVTLLFRTGLMFSLLQLAYCIGMQTDNVVIARIMGARSVADYAVPFRLFNFVNVFLVMLSGSMWPAYADAMARQDGSWIRRTFKRVSIGGTAITLVVTALLIILGNRLLALWVGPQIPASSALLMALGAQCVVYAYLQPINFLLNGIGRFKIQVICAIAMAFVNLGLSIVLVKRYGVIGAVLGTVIAQLLVQVIPLTIAAREALRDLGPKPKLQVSAAFEVSG